jgi:hypothetical protein
MPKPFLIGSGAFPIFFNKIFVADIPFGRNYASEMNLHNNVGYGTFKDRDFNQRQ